MPFADCRRAGGTGAGRRARGLRPGGSAPSQGPRPERPGRRGRGERGDGPAHHVPPSPVRARRASPVPSLWSGRAQASPGPRAIGSSGPDAPAGRNRARRENAEGTCNPRSGHTSVMAKRCSEPACRRDHVSYSAAPLEGPSDTQAGEARKNSEKRSAYDPGRAAVSRCTGGMLRRAGRVPCAELRTHVGSCRAVTPRTLGAGPRSAHHPAHSPAARVLHPQLARQDGSQQHRLPRQLLRAQSPAGQGDVTDHE